MDFNGSMSRICGAGAAEAGTFFPEPEPEQKGFPIAGTVKYFHKFASLLLTMPIVREFVIFINDTLKTNRPSHGE